MKNSRPAQIGTIISIVFAIIQINLMPVQIYSYFAEIIAYVNLDVILIYSFNSLVGGPLIGALAIIFFVAGLKGYLIGKLFGYIIEKRKNK